MKKNNKGFTLVELLGVIVILISILLIAIPTVTSSIERNKAKQKESKIELLLSNAQLYISDLKPTTSICVITRSVLLENGYITKKMLLDPYDNEKEIEGQIIYRKDEEGIEYLFCENPGDENGKCNVTTICE